jgi:hypothetical protein
MEKVQLLDTKERLHHTPVRHLPLDITPYRTWRSYLLFGLHPAFVFGDLGI